MTEVNAIFEYQCGFIEKQNWRNSWKKFFHGIIYLGDKKNSVDVVTADLCKQADLW